MTAWASATNIHLDVKHRHAPSSVLLFACCGHELVWVRHPLRGWEVPGGKVEPGEEPEQALEREAFEEAGIKLFDYTWMAEYQIIGQTNRPSYKWVYTGTASALRSRPASSEIIDVRLGKLLPPEALLDQADVSKILKDDMYVTLYPLLVQRFDQ